MRVAVVSPFIDKHHGTERAVAEMAEHLARDFGYAVTLYSQRVADIRISPSRQAGQPGEIHWRKVGTFPGPHLIRFLAWYWRNRRLRRKDARTPAGRQDLVFSAGINCPDANVILVHAVFHRLAELLNQSSAWTVSNVHRRLYYRLLCSLERKIYSDKRIAIAAVSQRTADQLAVYFERKDVRVVPNGVDTAAFSPGARESLRTVARTRWNYLENEIVALLVGNDWRNKGFEALLLAAEKCRETALRLLIVGADRPSDWRTAISKLGLQKSVQFASPSENILEYYAAADLLAAPSIEDSFNLPVLEAMACGLPVVTSTGAGVSGLLTHGEDCFILEQPRDSDSLAALLSRLVRDKVLRQALGQRAVETASLHTWKKSAAALANFMEESRRAK